MCSEFNPIVETGEGNPTKKLRRENFNPGSTLGGGKEPSDCPLVENRPLGPRSARDSSHTAALYVHIPFCVRKCPYCSFYSIDSYEQDLLDRFIEALGRELELVRPRLSLRTVYFGGGTPSLLQLHHWERIAKFLEEEVRTSVQEWTVECNPGTLSEQLLVQLRAIGVNRISLGIQSTDDRVLQRLGRIHSAAEAIKSYDLVRRCGFENVSVDLIYGVPGQTLEVWADTLKTVVSLGPEHVSAYELTVEEDTQFFEMYGLRYSVEQEEVTCLMHELAADFLGQHGYVQYEVSNYARGELNHIGMVPRYACLHNVGYWKGHWYVGVGPSAASYVDGIRSVNVQDVYSYCEIVELGVRPIGYAECLPPLFRAGEIAAFGFRMTSGWDLDEFRQITGFDLMEVWNEEINQLLSLGWAELRGSRLYLTSVGLRFADQVAEMFLR